MLKALHQGKHDAPLAEVVREARYVPESKKVADLLREMQREKFHMALVTDEYGSVTGLVSLEDLLEELVGEITDEYDREEPEFEQVGDERLPGQRARPRSTTSTSCSMSSCPTRSGTRSPAWCSTASGASPIDGEECQLDGLTFRAETVVGAPHRERPHHPDH